MIIQLKPGRTTTSFISNHSLQDFELEKNQPIDVLAFYTLTTLTSISSHMWPSSVRPARFFYLPSAAGTRARHPIA